MSKGKCIDCGHHSNCIDCEFFVCAKCGGEYKPLEWFEKAAETYTAVLPTDSDEDRHFRDEIDPMEGCFNPNDDDEWWDD